MEDLSLSDILAIFKRRRAYFLVTFLGLFALFSVVALRWAHYRASVTVQIEQPMISSSVANVAGADPADALMGLADRRISQIQQKVTSVESLNAIIHKLNLYPGANQTLPPEKLAAIMRSKIKLDFINSAISNPVAAQKETVERLSAIAFTLSFDYSDPELTKQAVDALVQHFIAEEAAQRLGQTEKTASFLNAELTQLEGEIKAQEQKIAEFKGKFGESGPTATLFNQQASMSNTMSLQNIESQITTNAATIGTLRSQLATTEPYLPTIEADGKLLTSPTAQLKSLQAQYAALTGRYGPEHPDVMKVSEQLKSLKAELAAKGKSGGVRRDADNPVYLQITAQLSAATAQQQALQSQREALMARQAKYDRAIAENPLLEQQMSQLTLDLDNAKQRYRELKEKMQTAEMRQKLQSGDNGQRLKIINPATVPEGTHPKRKLLLLAGFVLSLFSAIGVVILLELLRQSVRGGNHLASIVGVAPLVTIPHIALKHTGATRG